MIDQGIKLLRKRLRLSRENEPYVDLILLRCGLYIGVIWHVRLFGRGDPPVLVLSMILIYDVPIAGVFCNERLPHILVYDAIEDKSTIDSQSRLNNDLEFLNS